jgi:uncharacterized protein
VTTFNLDDNTSLYQVRAYSPGRIQINEQSFFRSVIVLPHQLIENWAPQTIEELTADTLQVLLELKPHILLLGTGTQLIFPAIEIYGELINAGIGVEIMDTGAACRTYNALSAENRDVAAALIVK